MNSETNRNKIKQIIFTIDSKVYVMKMFEIKVGEMGMIFWIVAIIIILILYHYGQTKMTEDLIEEILSLFDYMIEKATIDMKDLELKRKFYREKLKLLFEDNDII